MNITGPSVAKALRGTVGFHRSMVVIHDSLGHKTKALSVKLGGSANGHNGVRSVISALGGSADFYRFRIGIGRERDIDASEYVLSRLSHDELVHWGDDGIGLDIICSELGSVARNQAST